MQFPADDALAYNSLMHFPEPNNPKLLPCFMHQAFVAAVPSFQVQVMQGEDCQLMVSGQHDRVSHASREDSGIFKTAMSSN